MKALVLLLLAISLALLGTMCLFYPERLQAMDALDAERGLRGKVPAVKRYVVSGKYLVDTRIGGVICYLIAAICIAGIFRF